MGQYDWISLCVGQRLATGEESTRVSSKLEELIVRLHYRRYSSFSSQHGIPADTRRTSMEPVSSDLHYCPVTQ